MNKAYVQQYVKLEKEHWWFVVRQKIILQFLQKYSGYKPLSILNIGAAGGASSQWLSDLGHVVSVERDPFFIEYLQQQQIPVIDTSITTLPFENNSFDLVCAFDVIEHVSNDNEAIKEMERVCKPKGLICITVPANRLLWSEHDIVNEHKRRYSKRALLTLIENSSTSKNIELKYFNSLLFLPILTVRMFSRLFTGNNKNPESDFTHYKTSGPINALLKYIFSIELTLLRYISFPFGVSLLGLWEKSETGKEVSSIRS